MSVHYKFKSALSFDTITFDGLHISIKDLKKAILQQKQIGKGSDFDLQITNAQSNEVYEDENTLVPKNSSLIIVRVPLTAQQKKAWEKSDNLPPLGLKGNSLDGLDPIINKLAKAVDLTNVEGTEADKIQAAITQSTFEYDPSKYLRIKGSNQVGELPANYRCYKCFQPGHWIKDCHLSSQQDSIDIKKSTGIPRSFMVPVEGPEVPGAMMTPTGHFAVPSIEHEARKEPIRKPIKDSVQERPEIPNDLFCSVCKDLLTDAVLIPCCGNSFCDECIRNVLLESEDHQCPDCKEKDVSPDTLIPNRFLRNSVNKFKNQTGYTKGSITQSLKTNDRPPVNQPKTSPGRNTPPVKKGDENISSDDKKNSDEKTLDESSDKAVAEPKDDDNDQPLSNKGNAIPSLSNPNPNPNSKSPSIPSDGLPIQNIAVHPKRPIPNPKICLQGEQHGHHVRKEKHLYNRHERSGTPTVDEHLDSIPHRIEPLIPNPAQILLPPYAPYPGNYMYRPPFVPQRPDMPPFPPGVDEPYRSHYNRSRRPLYKRSPGDKTNFDDSVSEFLRYCKKERRSFSRSPVLRRRSRTRSRSRSRSRTRSRSRWHKSRSRSRSFTLSRSRSRSARSISPPLIRERPFSPQRRKEYRHSPQKSPLRYYSKKYSEEMHGSGFAKGMRRHPGKSQDYYQQDYQRGNDRYERFARDRERDNNRDREREKERFKRYEEDPMQMHDYDRLQAARNWEKTRDREMQLRLKEQQGLKEYKIKKKEQIEVEDILPPGVQAEEKITEIIKEELKTPEKEKKPKEKKKKKKEDSDKKKKKKKSKEKIVKQIDKIIPKPEELGNLYDDLGAPVDKNIIDAYVVEPKIDVKDDKDVVLAPLPELSKWEKDDEPTTLNEISNKSKNDEYKVTSEVIKRAENAIFKKVINPLKVDKKPERRVQLIKKDDEKKEKEKPNKMIEERRKSKDEPDVIPFPHRISAKERLGAKIEDILIVKKEIRGDRREIKIEKAIPKSIVKNRIKEKGKRNKEKNDIDTKTEEADSTVIDPKELNGVPKVADVIQAVKRAISVEREKEAKRIKLLNLNEDDESSDDSSLSSDDSDKKHKKKKKSKKKKKKKKKKKLSSSDSDSSSSSSDSELDKKKKKHRHKSHKKSKKKKKSRK